MSDMFINNDRVGSRSFKVSSSNALSAGAMAGYSFARSVGLSIPANTTYSASIQKNSNIAVELVECIGAEISIVTGSPGGSIVSLADLIPLNSVLPSQFFGSVDVFDGASTGDKVITQSDRLGTSFYPDGSMCIEISNNSDSTLNTSLSIGVVQISDVGVYSILTQDTQIEPTTEMSDYNGTN